jgi:hypothetical protein
VGQEPFVTVLQGWGLDDYPRCVELYQRAGIDLTAEPLVGVGSLCQRQATGEIEVIVPLTAVAGAPPHGFGVKGGRSDPVRLRTNLLGVLAGLTVAAGPVVGALNFRETQRQNRAM